MTHQELESGKEQLMRENLCEIHGISAMQVRMVHEGMGQPYTYDAFCQACKQEARERIENDYPSAPAASDEQQPKPVSDGEKRNPLFVPVGKDGGFYSF